MKPGREVVGVVASDWLRPRLGRTWRRGVVVGVTPRVAYVRMAEHDAVDGGHGGGGEVVAGAARPPAVGASPDDRGRSGSATRRPPATAAGSSTGSSAVPSAGAVLALEGPGAVGLPNGLDVPDARALADVEVGQPVAVGETTVVVGEVALAVRRWRRSRPVPGPANAATIRHRLTALGVVPARTVPSAWPDPPDELRTGVADLAAIARGETDAVAVVDRLLGWGTGSTPAGDDLLAAWIATMTLLAPILDEDARGVPSSSPVPPTTHPHVECAHHGHQQPRPARSTWDGPARVVARVRDRAPAATTGLSATLLEAAIGGAMARPSAAVLIALTSPSGCTPTGGPDPRHPLGPLPSATGCRDDGVEVLADRLHDLATVGHTSGRDLACGMLGAACHAVSLAESDPGPPATDPGPHAGTTGRPLAGHRITPVPAPTRPQA